MLKTNLFVSGVIAMALAMTACTQTPDEPAQSETVEPADTSSVSSNDLGEHDDHDHDEHDHDGQDHDEHEHAEAGSHVNMSVPDDLDENQQY